MKQSRQENLIYLAVWVLLFAAPLLSLYVRTVNGASSSFDWTEVLIVWRRFLPFLLLFLVHNFLLAPLLVHRHRRLVYASIAVVVIAAFTAYQCNSRPGMPGGPRFSDRPPMEREAHRHGPPARPHDPRPQAPSHPSASPLRPSKSPRHQAPPPIAGERDILAVVVLLLVFGANLGIKYYFHSRDDRKRLAELERENLEQQLEYLRYQINPHFFMNTLNNIHALVDIDPEKAKSTILELSKLMRYVLYEGDKQMVHVFKEFEFIRQYVTLMQLRYTDKVTITLDLPSNVADYQLPPLILITFIENAFKHGISYQRDSFVSIQARIDDASTPDATLHFACSNSKAVQPNPEKGGVGLANVRKRLDLLYDNNYTLNIDDNTEAYHVTLVIPLHT